MIPRKPTTLNRLISTQTCPNVCASTNCETSSSAAFVIAPVPGYYEIRVGPVPKRHRRLDGQGVFWRPCLRPPFVALRHRDDHLDSLSGWPAACCGRHGQKMDRPSWDHSGFHTTNATTCWLFYTDSRTYVVQLSCNILDSSYIPRTEQHLLILGGTKTDVDAELNRRPRVSSRLAPLACMAACHSFG